MTDPIDVKVPALGLVLLVGTSGSGKSTFARKHFLPTQVISSDFCRGIVSDDENDQAATKDAFDVLHYIVGTRLRRGLLTVVDATNVQQTSRAQLIRLAKDHDVLIDAIVLDVPDRVAAERNIQRPDRDFPDYVIKRQSRELRRGLRRMRREGFRRVHVLNGVDEVDRAVISTERAWNDRRDQHGPFDLIGDIHGCRSELETLLQQLGWQIDRDDSGRAVGAKHPEGRTAVFVGDLVDRGPDTPGVLRLVMGMVQNGDALCVTGNHEAKLVRALRGANVQVRHGLAESLEQLEREDEEFRSAVTDFMDGLIAHYVLDDGRLVVAHAGLKEEYHGRASGRVRSFALYGDTTGETDEYGLPVRYPWATEYRGKAMVVYGHTPVPEAEWINNTICLDTGVVFGGSLTALRYPERELVSVPAEQEWFEPSRPLAPPEREATVLRVGDVVGTQHLHTELLGQVKIPEENTAAALEVASRFTVDPRWLIYLPATMAPADSPKEPEGFLERPEQAFAEYERAGIDQVMVQEKHMGSRAVAVLARDADAAARRFGVDDGSTGVVLTRTGRSFFDDAGPLVARLTEAVAPLFDELNTDWLALDGELLPWSAKASGLIKSQYASVAAAARGALPAAEAVLAQAVSRGLPVDDLLTRTRHRDENATAFRNAFAAYTEADTAPGSLDGVRFAPFHILAGEGEHLGMTRPHTWHLETVGRLDDPFLKATSSRIVDLASASSRSEAVDWWLALTGETDANQRGEGTVVKPVLAQPSSASRSLQPGLKVRGREYLRIIYGPDYLDSLEVLSTRRTKRKRSLAIREHALGHDALARFVAGGPLWRVHQSVMGVLALESEPVDPRL